MEMMEEIVIKNIYSVDETIVFTTLRKLRERGDRSTLFQFKVQVKNQKVNALFDNCFLNAN
jgi:hypothetical protein